MNEIKNQKQSLKFHARRKKRGAAVAAVLCFAAAIAIVGTYTFRDYQKSKQEQELADAGGIQEQTVDLDPTKATNADEILNEDVTDNSADPLLMEDEGDTDDEAAVEEEDEADEEPSSDTESETEGENASQTAGSGTSVSFTEQDKLLWPVEGSLLMNYSMDKTVYFSTLDQFKYNPAIVIQGEKGDQVISSAPGVVKSIDKTAETGTTVNVDIGNGYELIYGQLSDVAVKTGDYVDSKTVLGYVGDPTIYYSVEGANVYFEMRKDGQPVNPMDYLVE